VTAPSCAELLRPGLLEGVSIMLASTGAAPAPGSAAPFGESLRAAVAESARALSARLRECPLPVEEEALAQRLAEEGAPDMLVVDAAGVFAGETEPRAALRRTMQMTWEVTRVTAGALIEQERPGRIVLLAPPVSSRPPDDRSHARATRAGLENLARTVSIEWSRYGITTVAIAPAPGTFAQTLAALCAYLASPAGSYFSGCLLALDGPEPAMAPPSGTGAGDPL
jgi:citronellol/citronellal dehydrogenase